MGQQQRLRNAHVVLLGIGGIGSWVALILTQLGIGPLTLADIDIVKSSNLIRQTLHTECDIGRHKATVASEALHAINSEIQLTTVTQNISTEEKLAPLCRGSNLVIITCGPFLLPDHQASARLLAPWHSVRRHGRAPPGAACYPRPDRLF